MNEKRRQILKLSGLTALGISAKLDLSGATSLPSTNVNEMNLIEPKLSIIGRYGEWATQLKDKQLAKFSFRNTKYTDLKAWQKEAKSKLLGRMAVPEIAGLSKVKIVETLNYDGLHIEKLTWQLS